MSNIEGKVDTLLSAVLTMQPVVSDIKAKLEAQDKRLDQIVVNDAVQDQKLTDSKSFIDGVNKKLQKHIDGHWRWVTILLGIMESMETSLPSWSTRTRSCPVFLFSELLSSR